MSHRLFNGTSCKSLYTKPFFDHTTNTTKNLISDFNILSYCYIMLTIPGYQLESLQYETDYFKAYNALRNQNRGKYIIIIPKTENSVEATKCLKDDFIAISKFDSQHILKAIELIETASTVALIMEHFQGDSFDLSKNKHIFQQDDKRWLFFAINMAQALKAVHQFKIHGNINPSNIQYDHLTGLLKLVGIGQSSTFAVNSFIESPCASPKHQPLYMSPEQSGQMNKAIDLRSDFYSLGIILYELILGQPPFQGEDLSELVHLHLAVTPHAPHQLNTAIPKSISDIIMKLIKKGVSARYQNASGLLHDLRQCQSIIRTSKKTHSFILGEKDVLSKLKIPDELFGRELEIEALTAAYQRMKEGSFECCLIQGNSGIGKTSLVNELKERTAIDTIYFISGKIDQFGHNTPYEFLVQVSQDLINQLLTEGEERISEWRKLIQQAVGSNGKAITEIIPEIELIIGKQPDLIDLAPMESFNRFKTVLQNLVSIFATSEHPLLVFIDDLQWIGRSSLELLEWLLLIPEQRYILFIGAFRDNEVDQTHPLTETISRLKHSDLSVNTISLEALEKNHINQIIQQTTQKNQADTAPLAELSWQMTNGNPYFLHQFLHKLVNEKLIFFDLSNGSWDWNIERIRQTEISNNVVDLIIDDLKDLPPDIKKLLEVASCVGIRFKHSLLKKFLGITDGQLAIQLQEAIELLYVIPVIVAEKNNTKQDQTYKFSHDNILQAVYSKIPELEKQEIHLSIGSQLLDNNNDNNGNEKIFDIVNQLNLSKSLIQEPSKRFELAELNQMAGIKAKRSSAYVSARDYFSSGIELLDGNSWNTHYDLTMGLHLELADAASLSGDYAYMTAMSKEINQHSKSLFEESRLYEIEIRANIAQHNMQNAIRISLEILKKLGIHIPTKFTKLATITSLLRLKFMLSNVSMDALSVQPIMTDKRHIEAMRILMNTAYAAYVVLPNLVPLIVFKMMQITLIHGHSVYTPYAYSSFAFIHSAVLGSLKQGNQYGQLAMALLDKLEAKAVACKVYLMVHVFINHWNEHLAESLQPLLTGYQKGIETGDLEYGGTCIYMYCDHLFYLGRNLTEVQRQTKEHTQTIKRLNQERLLCMIQEIHQLTLNLSGQSESRTRLKGPDFDEDLLLPKFEKANDHTSLGSLYANKAMLEYLFDHHPKALKYSRKVIQYLGGLLGFINIPRYYFYDSLIHLAMFNQLSFQQRILAKKRIATNQKKMKKWAHFSPKNHLHRFHLVEAERSRVKGKSMAALTHFEKAIALAKENEYLNEESLANELTGKFWMEIHQEKLARSYLLEAYLCYERWGALAKQEEMEKKYAWLAVKKTQVQSPVSMKEILDSETILKASSTLASEIIFDRLIEKMMTIVIENAGAEKGVFISNNDGKLVIMAEVFADLSKVKKIEPIGLKESQYEQGSDIIPRSIIDYVARTKKSLIIHDASKARNFKKDPYLQSKNPKSLMSFALMHQQKLAGILYLENNLATGVFSKDRTALLLSLSSHIAIAIENARMYQKVKNLSGQILSAQEEERKRLARELHDGLGQSLLAIKLNLQMLEAKAFQKTPELKKSFMEVLTELSKSIEELREISMDLRPSFLEDIELGDVIQWHAKKFEQRTKLQVIVEVEKIQNLQSNIKENLYRIYQEAINNIVKHARSNRLVISLSQSESIIRLSISDDGQGFNANVVEKNSIGLGLKTMRERAELLGGSFIINNTPNTGTTVIVEVPLSWPKSKYSRKRQS
jgi:predicted ATPase/signal transduction histidine kinase